ncbi:MAG: NYN domain-containing protein [Candidatus Nomurabacteria bacterium]|jgi:uncharacterized LabA/DUF88 family protein|nr:NYN domain-containing protein [Candidatus Nomurabacteria bacterium]
MNQAFIDGQNLRLGTTKSNWKVDLVRFRRYLSEKYNVDKAYYFLGAVNNNYAGLYKSIQESGFIIIFREHSDTMIGKKKGNVDTDIVFEIMQKLVEKEKFDKIVLVSGDGDYFKTVQYLIEKGRFERLLAPSKLAMSSLYRQFLKPGFYDFLDKDSIKQKIAYKKRR